MQSGKRDARLSFRLSSEQKKTIEDAAAEMGMTVSGFAVSMLAQAARKVLHNRQTTRLSEQDWKLFVALLEQSSRPNKALIKATKRYKKQIG